MAQAAGLDNVQALALDISELTALNSAYDLVVETTGVPVSMNVAVKATGLRGGILCIAPMHQAELDVHAVVHKGLSVVGSIGGTGHFEPALDLLCSRVDEAQSLIGQRVSFEELVAVFPSIAHNSVSGKVLVAFPPLIMVIFGSTLKYAVFPTKGCFVILV